MSYAQQLRQEGEQEGIQIGKQKAQSDIAKRLVEAHIDPRIIENATGIPLPEIEKLEKQLTTKH